MAASCASVSAIAVPVFTDAVASFMAAQHAHVVLLGSVTLTARRLLSSAISCVALCFDMPTAGSAAALTDWRDKGVCLLARLARLVALALFWLVTQLRLSHATF